MIYAKWLRSLRFGNDYFKLIDSDDYYLTYHRYITNLLAQPAATVRLAVLSDDRDVVLGFSVTRGNILDYVHVHKDHRRCKIGTHLIPCGIDTITHVTKSALPIWNNKYSNWKFNPFS
jgi:GNAT superfamily N-acetyltransferase